jgi:hypothetical protein
MRMTKVGVRVTLQIMCKVHEKISSTSLDSALPKRTPEGHSDSCLFGLVCTLRLFYKRILETPKASLADRIKGDWILDLPKHVCD